MDGRTLWGEHALALRRRGLAEGTIRQRRYLVTAWFRWLELKGVGVFDANADLVDLFLDGANRKASARCSTTSHLHMFYVWAISRGYTDRDPTAAVDRPRQAQGLPRPVHSTDLQLALVFAQEGPAADPRMEVALLLGAVSGLRACELARLRWDDIRDGHARVLGKGSKERVVPLNAETLEALDRIPRTGVYVLDGWQGRQSVIQPGGRASAKIARHFRRAGAAGTAHQLRHRAATEALGKCHDLRLVQTLLGHGSVATTAIYTKVNPAHLAAIIVDVNTPRTVDVDWVA